MNIISRKEAKKQNLKRYFTGVPCKRGHLSERRTTGACIECAKASSTAWRKANPVMVKEYKAVWNNVNREKVKKHNAKWRAENAEKIKSTTAKWRVENPEKAKSAAEKWRKENIERARASSAAWALANPERVKAKNAAWVIANPESKFIRNSLHRIFTNWKGSRAKSEALLGYTYDELRSHLEKQFVDGMGWHNRSDWNIDHIIPISHHLKNGVTDPAIINCLSNLQPIWAKDNFSKGGKVLVLC